MSLENHPPKGEAAPETFSAKRLLLPQGGMANFFAASDTLNLYRGCNHGCIYCDTRSECYHIDRFDTVRHKENCIAMLEGELRRKKQAGTVMMGAASDPYNHLEEKLCITRQALELLRRYHFGAGISTKGALVARDAEVLCGIGKNAPCWVAFSITAAKDSLSALIEPGAPVSSLRFRAMAALAKAGVFTGIWLNPVLPFLTDDWENLRTLLQATKESGGRFALCHFGMTLRTGNREYFFAALDKEPSFRGIKQKYADSFQLSYGCPSPNAEKLYGLFHKECKRLGLLDSFPEVNRAMREGCPKQITMF